MPQFKYTAKDKTGATVEGQMEAVDSGVVASRLAELGFIPISINKKGGGGSSLELDKFMISFQRVKMEEQIVFVRQLSSILEAGVPLLESLQALFDQITTPRLKGIIGSLMKDIESGSSFSEALSKFPEVFSLAFVAMIRVGEHAGILGDVLDRLAGLLENDYENVQKIKGATRYPMLVFITLSVAFTFVITFVVPKFSSIFQAGGAKLPVPTQILIGINDAVSSYWYIILPILIVSYNVFRYFTKKNPQGKLWWDGVVLKLPVFGPLNKKLTLSRFARMLSAMLKAGVPILNALLITKDTIDNRVVSDMIGQIREEVSQGKSLAEPMRKNAAIIPPLAVQMVAIGEKSGNLEGMLSKVADYFDRDADYTIKNLTPLIEPFMIFILAIFVTILALGIFLPMWDLIKVYQQ